MTLPVLFMSMPNSLWARNRTKTMVVERSNLSAAPRRGSLAMYTCLSPPGNIEAANKDNSDRMLPLHSLLSAKLLVLMHKAMHEGSSLLGGI